MKKFYLGFVLIVMLSMFAGCGKAVTVREGEVGIVVKLGKAQDEVLYPGFYFTMPFLTKVHKMNVQWQKYYIETSAFSKDMQQVDIKCSMNYSLQKQGAWKMYTDVGKKYEGKIMLPLALDALKSTFSRYSAEELVANRDMIAAEVFNELKLKLTLYDISVQEVAIEDIDFSDAFTNAIEAKQVATQTLLQAETEQKQQTLIAQAEAERAMIKAKSESEQRLIRAQAEADAVRIAADAEAYRLEMESKHITDAVIQKETVEKWDGKLPTITGTDAVPLINTGAITLAE